LSLRAAERSCAFRTLGSANAGRGSTMDIQKYGLMTGAAVVVAMGLGLGAARLTDVSEPVESERHEEEGGEIRGFIPLTLTAAAQAGVSIVAVERGGGTELKLPGRVAF